MFYQIIIMQVSNGVKIHITLVFCIVLGFANVSMAQFRHPQDSLPTMLKKDSVQRVGLLEPKSIGVQFLCGEIAYAIPFWTLVYPRIGRYNAPDPVMVLGMSLACFGGPWGTDLILETLGWNRSNPNFGVAGWLVGFAIPVFFIQSDRVFDTFLYLGVTSVLTSMLFYDISGLIWPDEPK